MSQYRTGTVAVISNSATVRGTGTSWLSEIEPGHLFNIVGSSAIYVVAAVQTDAELSLSRVYAAASESGVDYSISRDFTPRHGLPYPTAGDDISAILAKVIRRVDALVPVAPTSWQRGNGTR